ncbi:MAG: hypothetical protein R2845_03045 [Thermomicrobiales bacterium]
MGKASTRERVGSYFSQAIGYTRKMDGLLESLVSIETHQTGNELEALLLEAQLIRFYQPRYNIALRASENYPVYQDQHRESVAARGADESGQGRRRALFRTVQESM